MGIPNSGMAHALLMFTHAAMLDCELLTSATQGGFWIFCFPGFFSCLKLLLEFEWSGLFGSGGAGDNVLSVDFLCPSLNTS